MARPVVEHIVNGKQVCRRCKKDKLVDCFHKSTHKVSGISQYCKICTSLNRTESKERIKSGNVKHIVGLYKKGSEELKNHNRNQKLKYNYGITINDYNLMFTNQKGCCAICNIHQSKLKRPLDVDHDHTTGEIRGLLCSKCNTGIGLFNDNIELLSLSINYLQIKINKNNTLKFGNLIYN